jgi:hypothetical protein
VTTLAVIVAGNFTPATNSDADARPEDGKQRHNQMIEPWIGYYLSIVRTTIYHKLYGLISE